MKLENKLISITALRDSGVFPDDRKPTLRTLREWTRLKMIPHIKCRGFVYYDAAEIEKFIRKKMQINPRGEDKEKRDECNV